MENKYRNIDKLLFAMATIVLGCALLGSSAAAYIGLVTRHIGSFTAGLVMSVFFGWMMFNTFKRATK